MLCLPSDLDLVSFPFMRGFPTSSRPKICLIHLPSRLVATMSGPTVAISYSVIADLQSNTLTQTGKAALDECPCSHNSK
jgi:hypothetical protein